MMPKLSIITINYNNVNGLEKTIESVVSQSFRDYEYIVIDGGSNDGSIECIKKYSDKITHWVSEKDSGIYNAQNKGILLAKGEYCLFLNSGDYLYKEDVLEQVFSSGATADIIYGDMMIDDGSADLVYGKQPAIIDFEYLIHTTLWHPVSFIKKVLFDKLGLYNEKLKIISDYEFFLRAICVERVSTFHLPVAVSVFNTQGIGSSKEHDALHQAERKLVQERYFSKEAIKEARRSFNYKRMKEAPLSYFVNRFPLFKGTAVYFYSMLGKKKQL